MSAPFSVDTSVLVAALLSWHEHHEPSREALSALWDERPLLLPLPALIEAYAVMTRLPAPHRLEAHDAYVLLRENFSADASVVSLESPDAWALLERLESRAVAGGRTYDAQILAAAEKGGATLLLTLNVKDFLGLARPELQLRSPLDGA